MSRTPERTSVLLIVALADACILVETRRMDDSAVKARTGEMNLRVHASSDILGIFILLQNDE